MTRQQSGWAVGQQFTEVIVQDLTRSQIVQYAGASGDFNPIHTDEVYATRVAGLPSVFAHGMLTMGACGAFVQRLLGETTLQRYSARFVQRVWPGDTLTATATVSRTEPDGAHTSVELELTVTNQADQSVLRGAAHGTPSIHPPTNVAEKEHARA